MIGIYQFSKRVIIKVFFFLIPSLVNGLPPNQELSKQAPPKVNKTNSSTQTLTFKQLKWTDKNKLTGARSTTTFYLPVPKQWQYVNGKLHLLVSHSELIQDNSSITFDLNGHVLSTMQLDAKNVVPSYWDIELPLNNHQSSDWLNLNFIGSLHVSADLCKDMDNPGNWAYISPDSTLTINYKKLDYNPNMAPFPYPFINNNILETTTSLLVIPPVKTIKELVPAMEVVRALGTQLEYNQITLNPVILTSITEEQKKNNNLIFVGNIEQLTPTINSNFMQNLLADKQSDVGGISLDASPWNPYYAMLILTGPSNLALEKAVSVFNTPQFNQFFQNKLYVNEKPQRLQAKDKEINLEKIITLKDLGYKEQVALGLGSNDLAYTISLPYNKMPEQLIIKTVFSHSYFSNDDRSMLAISVNGVKQASVQLTSNNEQREVWTVEIPGEALNPGKNNLTYTFDLHIPKVKDCGPEYNLQSWGVINAETSLKSTFINTDPRINFNNFSLIFEDNSLIVVPDEISERAIKTLSNVFLKLGSILGYEPSLQLIGAKEVNLSMLKKHSALFIGTLENNPWIAQVMTNAPLRINQDKIELYDEHGKLSLDIKAPLGVVELIKSPWNKQKYSMLVTGTSNTAMEWAIELITDDTLRSRLTGNVATITENGQLNNFDIRPEPPQKPQKAGRFFYQNWGLALVSIFLVIMIGLFIVGFISRHRQ